MRFWELNHPSEQIAIVDGASGFRWSYGDLQRKADALRTLLPSHTKSLGFLLCQNKFESVAAYIGALQARTAVALFDAALSPELLANLLLRYRPQWVVAPMEVQPSADYRTTAFGESYCVWQTHSSTEIRLFPELGILLSTSGSTGSPKLVRLSYANVQTNADSIRQYLMLTSAERPITSLPMPYSYALSVINSHLLAGATLLMTDQTIVQRSFWDFFEAEQATSLAGVPYMYQTMLRIGLLKRDLPSLRTLTQAGGALAPKLVEQVHTIARQRGWSFFVMYGQTEAAPRISYVPPQFLAEKVGSIGIPIPGGRMCLNPDTGEIIYSGSNVMLGYAQSPDDLACGDELNGVLHTGDLGRQDESGFFYVTGRMRRFLKVHGQRLSLDEIERNLQHHFEMPFACFGTDERLCIAVEDSRRVSMIAQYVSAMYQLHHSAVSVGFVERLPHTANGKTDYNALAAAEPVQMQVNRSHAITD